MSLNNQELHKESIKYLTTAPIRENDPRIMSALDDVVYEFLRSAFGFPLLIKKYGYSCFEKVYQQVEKQYQDMPEAFKGHLTFDEDGKQVSLRTPMKIKQMIDRFYESRNLR